MDREHPGEGLDFDKYRSPAKTKKKEKPTNCESCVHYDYDEDADCYVCGMDLDEDEQQRFVTHQTRACPYYRYYDEYKSVRRQN